MPAKAPEGASSVASSSHGGGVGGFAGRLGRVLGRGVGRGLGGSGGGGGGGGGARGLRCGSGVTRRCVDRGRVDGGGLVIVAAADQGQPGNANAGFGAGSQHGAA